MLLSLVSLLQIAKTISQPLQTQQPHQLTHSLAEDDECSAALPDLCTLSALQVRGRKDSQVVIEGLLLTNNPRRPTSYQVCPAVTPTNQLDLGICIRKEDRWIYSLASKTFKRPGEGGFCLTAADKHNVTVTGCRAGDQSQQFDFKCAADSKKCHGSISSVKYSTCVVIERQHLTTRDGHHTYEKDSLKLGDCGVTKFAMKDMFDTPKRRQMLKALAALRTDSTPLLLESRVFSSPDGESWHSSWMRRIELSPHGLYRMVTASSFDDYMARVDRHSVVLSSGEFNVEGTELALMSRKAHAEEVDLASTGHGGWKIVKDEAAASEKFLGLKLTGAFLNNVTEV